MICPNEFSGECREDHCYCDNDKVITELVRQRDEARHWACKLLAERNEARRVVRDARELIEKMARGIDTLHGSGYTADIDMLLCASKPCACESVSTL